MESLDENSHLNELEEDFIKIDHGESRQDVASFECNSQTTQASKNVSSKVFGSKQETRVKREIKVLVIGATGAGKTSLINLFYIWSKKWGTQEIAQSPSVLIKTEHLHGDEEAESDIAKRNESRTNTAKNYCFELQDPKTKIYYDLNFLDTPGIGDTGGMEKDETNFRLILDTVQKTPDLNAILLVMNGSESRVNTRISYIMVKLQGMIPDTLRDNLVVLLTNVDLDPNLDINAVLDFEINQDKVFYYNNQIFKLKPSRLSDCNIKVRLDQSYRNSLETLSNLLDTIANCPPKSTKEFQIIKESRDKLKKQLVELSETDAKINKKRQELQRIALIMTNGQLEISDLHKRLSEIAAEEEFQCQPTSYYNTTCLACKKCCHENCGLEETMQEGSSYFRRCTAFAGLLGRILPKDTCKECKHSYTSHVHLRFKYIRATTTTPQVNSKIQQALSKIQNETDAQTHARDVIDAELREFDQELEQNHLEIKKIIKTMQDVCSRFDYIKEIDACINVLDEQIETASNNLSFSTNSASFNTHDALKKTRAGMEKLKKDLTNHLKK